MTRPGALATLLTALALTACSEESEPSGDVGPPASTSPQGTTPQVTPADMAQSEVPVADMAASDGEDMEDMADTDTADMAALDMAASDGEDMADTDMAEPSAPQCGNDLIEAGETCDGDCATDCDDGDACTMDGISGQASQCNVACSNIQVNSSCGPSDGCCPAGCEVGQDEDCVIDCTRPDRWPAAWVDFEEQVIALVNAKRAAGATCAGGMIYPPQTPPVAVNGALRQIARCHAHDMILRAYFGSADPEGLRVSDRARAVGYAYATIGQDVGAGRATPQEMVDHWMTRENACRHIMSADYEEIGLGYGFGDMSSHTHYWVQVVANPSGP